MGVGGIGTGNKQTIGLINIGVTSRRCICTQGRFVTSHRRRHAQARVGVDVVGANQALGQFVEDVIIFGQQLAGNIKRDTVRPVLPNRFGKPRRRMIKCSIPADTLTCRRAGGAELRKLRACGVRIGQMQGRALGAQAAEIGRMIRVSAHTGNPRVIAFNEHAAANAAITTGGLCLSHALLLATDVPRKIYF